MTVSVISLVTVLVFVMLGYQFNEEQGRIVQGGLVQFDSTPSGANVTIDGAAFKSYTPSKTTMASGQHNITMDRDGYMTWQKTVDVMPGSVLWLNYARLIPRDLVSTSVADFSKVSSTAVSKDSKIMAIKEISSDGNIQLADLTGDTVKMTNIEVPSNLYTKPASGKSHSFALVNWDYKSQYILVNHTFNDGEHEWIVVDSKDVGASQNITKLLDINASKVVFSGNDNKMLYALNGSDVRRIDLNKATISRPLVANVAEFSIYGDSTIVFTSTTNSETKKRSVGFYKEGSDKAQIVRSYAGAAASPFRLAIGKYYGDTYFAIAQGEKIEILKGDINNPSAAQIVDTETITGGADHLSIVIDGRFVIAQNGATYVTYDLESSKTTTTLLKGKTAVTKELRWIDNYSVVSDRDGIARLYEYDGTNQHDIMPVVSGLDVTLSPNSTYLYGISKSADGKYHLSRVKLVL